MRSLSALSHSAVHFLMRTSASGYLNPPLGVGGAEQMTHLQEVPGSHSGFPIVILCFLWNVSVPPTVTVSQSSPSSDLVAITCHVQRFYPQSVHLTWIENCHIFKGAEELTSKQNSDGTYTLESLHLVNVSGQVSERVLTCKVQHEAQSPIQANLILPTAAHGIYKPIGSSGKLISTALRYGSPLSPE